MPSLYNLKTDYEKVLSMMYDEDVNMDAVLDTCSAIEDAIEDKADAYAMIMKDMDGNISAIKAEEDRLRQRRIALENRKSRLQANLYDAMKSTGKTKFKTALFSFGIQKNGGKRALVLDVDPIDLPHTLRIIDYKPNNDAIREFMGEEESCAFAHLAEQGESLRIR